MKQQLSSLTVVTVVDEAAPDQALCDRLAAMLADGGVVDFDIVLVANAVNAPTTLALKDFVARVPDTTVVFLNSRQHSDVARLVGINHAVGDHVLFTRLSEPEIAALPALLAPLREGYDLVVADPVNGKLVVRRPPAQRLLLGAYLRFYRLLTGVALESRPTGMRALSRAAALFIAGHPAAEVLLRARDLGANFPARTVPVLPAQALRHVPAPLRRSWSTGMNTLLSASTLPLRAATYVGLLGGVASMAYAVYVLCVFVFKRGVIAGWTTISLQLAAMTFIFSVLFMLLSEYVLQIHAANPPRSLRHLVLRELRSPLSRRSGRLNVVDAEGRFHLGAPPGPAPLPAGAAA
jgi:polyisoprenyl-phosphate glycosyltransferase